MLRYSILTPEQKEKICNGCGAKGGWVKPPNFIFNASCDHHDFLYWLGNTEADRKYADKAFYKKMKEDINDRSYNWSKRLWYRMWSWSYYRAVRLFGKKAFYYGETKRTLEGL